MDAFHAGFADELIKVALSDEAVSGPQRLGRAAGRFGLHTLIAAGLSKLTDSDQTMGEALRSGIGMAGGHAVGKGIARGLGGGEGAQIGGGVAGALLGGKLLGKKHDKEASPNVARLIAKKLGFARVKPSRLARAQRVAAAQ